MLYAFRLCLNAQRNYVLFATTALERDDRVRTALRSYLSDLRAEIGRRGLSLAPVEPRTPLQWVGLVLLWVGVIALGLVLLPLVIVAAPFFFIALRRHETTDPVIDRRSDAARTRAIAVNEDRDVTNPFSAIGSLKPGFLRLAITVVALWLVNLSGILVYNRGRLARVSTIHFARWVLLDGNRRVFFASNYDGSLESYMDDFINKVAFGLNLVFSNGIAYPPTDWLVLHGAQREHMFKNFLHRRQVPTDVWYKAYAGLTTADLARNARIRQGFERDDMSDEEIQVAMDDVARWSMNRSMTQDDEPAHEPDNEPVHEPIK